MRSDVSLDAGQIFAPLAGRNRLGLAVSGGPDSLALMLLAARWAKQHDVTLFVYSVDHGLRSEAAGEATMVAREAERLGLAVRILKWEGAKPATGIQAAARRARYRLIGEAMKADGAEVLLTAHHMDDQAETVLMRMAHGSGIEGLKAMLPLAMVEGVAIARPLLGVAHAELVAVVKAAGLEAAADPSNDDAHYERVRWRALLPQLAELGLDAARLAKLAERLADADEAVAGAAATLIAKWAVESDGAIKFPLARLRATYRAVAIRVVASLLDRIHTGRKSRELGAVERLCDSLVDSHVFKPMTLHGSIVATDGEFLILRREGPRRGTGKAREKATSH
jgi:tRNA(Ile)-lysidine synthase